MKIESGIYEKGTISLEQIYAELRTHPDFAKAINLYKSESPIWKKEFLGIGKLYWIEEPKQK